MIDTMIAVVILVVDVAALVFQIYVWNKGRKGKNRLR
jgi:hypothetical protein